ncbi:MAG TPA: tetratricopeptide repeat protein [Cytophagaceae bacterium]
MAKTTEGKGTEIFESPDALVEKFNHSGEYLKKYRNLILYAVAGLALAVAGFIYYKYTLKEQNKQAQIDMFPAVRYFELDSLNRALNGDGKNLGLLQITEDYSGTKAAELANFYIGNIYLKQGKYEDAIKHLKEFNANDLLVQARAYSLIGDAYMELNDLDNAIKFYLKATNYKPTEQFTPRYLLKLGLAYEKNKEFGSAVKAYSQIIDKYSKAQEVNEAKKYKARAEVLAAN